jgi:DNA-binding response OmpR family regulator
VSRKKVLVCDDDLHILEAVSFVVRTEGYHVLTAENGDEALSLFRAERPDLVFLDVMMPGKDGYEVCREIKNDKLCNSYVILLTARAQPVDRERGYANGAEDYVEKPFWPSRLRELLHKLLDGEP